MPEKALRVELIRSTEGADKLVALGARLCYAAVELEDLREQINAKDQETFISRVMDSGHLSVLEHASFTFAVEGVSRVLLAQLTRHRIASFSVQSQRYVSMGNGFDYIVPPAIAALGREAEATYHDQMRQMHQWYTDWQSALGGAKESSNEDARFVLPGACATRLIVTMNARELLHFFALRCCNRAQWEIRAMAREMLKLAYHKAPALFEQAGPGCISGACPEGKMSCGKKAQVCKEFAKMKASAERKRTEQ